MPPNSIAVALVPELDGDERPLRPLREGVREAMRAAVVSDGLATRNATLPAPSRRPCALQPFVPVPLSTP
jgi:hypothetical protein